MKNKKQSNILDNILETYDDIEFAIADGLDDAVVGVDANNYILIYDIEKCIQATAKNMSVTKKDLSEEEIEEGITVAQKKYEIAKEFFYFNTLDAFVEVKGQDGKLLPRPIFMDSQF